MAEAEKPEIAIYVRAVPGRAVHRFGSSDPYALIGATIVKDGAKLRLEWDKERVVPVGAETYRRFYREYEKAIRSGDLKRATDKDFAEWVKIEAAREAKAEADRIAAANAAKKAAEAAAKAKLEENAGGNSSESKG